MAIICSVILNRNVKCFPQEYKYCGYRAEHKATLKVRLYLYWLHCKVVMVRMAKRYFSKFRERLPRMNCNWVEKARDAEALYPCYRPAHSNISSIRINVTTYPFGRLIRGNIRFQHPHRLIAHILFHTYFSFRY